MTTSRRTSRSFLNTELWARAGGVTHRNLGVGELGDPLPDWVFTQGVELSSTAA